MIPETVKSELVLELSEYIKYLEDDLKKRPQIGVGSKKLLVSDRETKLAIAHKAINGLLETDPNKQLTDSDVYDLIEANKENTISIFGKGKLDGILQKTLSYIEPTTECLISQLLKYVDEVNQNFQNYGMPHYGGDAPQLLDSRAKEVKANNLIAVSQAEFDYLQATSIVQKMVNMLSENPEQTGLSEIRIEHLIKDNQDNTDSKGRDSPSSVKVRLNEILQKFLSCYQSSQKVGTSPRYEG